MLLVSQGSGRSWFLSSHQARPNSAQDAEGMGRCGTEGRATSRDSWNCPAAPLPSLLSLLKQCHGMQTGQFQARQTVPVSNLLLEAAISASRRQVSQSSACEPGAAVNSYFT